MKEQELNNSLFSITGAFFKTCRDIFHLGSHHYKGNRLTMTVNTDTMATQIQAAAHMPSKLGAQVNRIS